MKNDDINIDQLKRNDELYKNVVINSSQLFYIHNTNHVLSYVSPQSKDMLGYTPEEMMVKWTSLLTDNPVNKEGVEKTNKTIQTGVMQNPYNLELIKKDGSVMWAEVHETPIKNDKGEVVGITGSLSDITERKEARDKLKLNEQRLQKFQLGLDRIDEVVFMTNKDGIFEYINPAFERLYGYSFNECRGKTPRILKSGKLDQQYYEGFWEKLLEKSTLNIVLTNKTKDGRLVEISASVGSILNKGGEIIGYLATQRDITHEKENEIQLKTQYDSIISLSRVGGVEELIRIGLDRAIEISGTDVGGIYLFNDDGSLDLAHSKGLSKEFVSVKSHYSKDSKNVEIILKGESIYTSYSELFTPKDGVTEKEGLEQLGIIPIMHDGEVLGSVNVSMKSKNKMSDQVKKSLNMIVSQIGLLLTSKRSEEKLRLKMIDLEKINKLMVGREIKMAELKNELLSKEKSGRKDGG